MYNKLFTKILDSTIWLENDATRLVWITLLACMDEEGFAALSSVGNVAARARVSLEAAQQAIEALESPDHLDPTQDHEGKRIERVPYGWMILNAGKYRDLIKRETIKAQTRERVAQHRAKRAEVTQCNENVTPSDTDTDTDPVPNGTEGKTSVPPARCPALEIISLYHEVLPTLPKMLKVTPARKAQIRARWQDGNQDLAGWRGFFEYIGESDFLMGKSQTRNGSSLPFIADLEWITKSANWAKIVDGKYHRD